MLILDTFILQFSLYNFYLNCDFEYFIYFVYVPQLYTVLVS